MPWLLEVVWRWLDDGLMPGDLSEYSTYLLGWKWRKKNRTL
jgi:hypothetical protein